VAGSAEGHYLRTGDLGFLDEGDLFVTGRLKDLLIIRGRNHYPQDIECTAELSHPSLQLGSGAAFSVELDGQEPLVIAAEMERRFQVSRAEELVRAIIEAVAEHHEIQPGTILFLKAGGIPKTSSGKIQRGACKSRFLAGEFNPVYSWTRDPLETF